MPIQHLTSIVPPPKAPNNVGTVQDRHRIETETGIVLPDDYWEYATVYGTGRFVSENFEFTVSNPYSDAFQTNIEWEREAFETLSADQDIPYDVFPANPGLFPWGNDVNGNSFFWFTEGSVSDWPIIVCPETGNANDIERVNMAFISFLTNAFCGKHVCREWTKANAFVDGVPPRFVPC